MNFIEGHLWTISDKIFRQEDLNMKIYRYQHNFTGPLGRVS